MGRVLVILNDIQLQSTHCCHFPLGGCILADHGFTISSFNCYAVYTIISYITKIYWEYKPMFINSLWPSDTILWHRSGSTWVNLNQCWLIISKALWHSFEGNFTGDDSFLQCLPSGNRNWCSQNLITVCTLKQSSRGTSCGFKKKNRTEICLDPTGNVSSTLNIFHVWCFSQGGWMGYPAW